MRSFLFLTAILVASAAHADEAKLPPGSDTCLECHKPGGDGPTVQPDVFAKSVHAANGVSCADCHQGYTPEHAMGGALPALAAADQKVVDRLSKGSWGEGEKKHGVTAPRAYLASATCHGEVTAAFEQSVHSRWLREDAKVSGPTCTSCHGSIHGVTKLAAY